MIEIIPAIDIIDGKCVRLSQGDYDSKKVYNENPVEVAKEFEANGIRRLHVVDLDGAASHHVVNYRVLERIAVHTSLVIVHWVRNGECWLPEPDSHACRVLYIQLQELLHIAVPDHGSK